MRKLSDAHIGDELSRFLIAYLLMLLSVLMLVHVLQPERDGPGSSSRSPVQKERQYGTQRGTDLRRNRPPALPSGGRVQQGRTVGIIIEELRRPGES